MSSRVYFRDYEKVIMYRDRKYVGHTSGGYADMTNGRIDLVILDDLYYTNKKGEEVPENDRLYQSFMDSLEKDLKEDKVLKIA